jgi:diguanylate cyclase (GGDEF)-like protein
VLREFGRLVMSKMELRLLARRDALTAALSRRAFEEHLEAQIADAGTSQRPMSLLMVDIDNFKHVNDRYGHPVGDLVLRAVADAIRSTLRAADRLGRLGGEEFGVLLSDIGPGTAYALAVRITRHVAALSLPALQGQTVSVSCGVAHWREHGKADAISWIASADVALYRAKRSGRNRVEVAGPDIRESHAKGTVPPGLSALARFSADEVLQRLRDSHGSSQPSA